VLEPPTFQINFRPITDQALQRTWTKLLGLVSSEMLQGAAEAETA